MTTATRGSGLLENFLAQRRSAQARKLIQHAGATGPVLDIGCGAVPTFLLGMQCDCKVGLERFAPTISDEDDIDLVLADAASARFLPFRPDTFGVITLLAVLEHLREENLPSLINEIFRALRPDGIFVMTTPAGRVGTLLRVLTKIRFVSAVEIGEHQRLYGKTDLRQLLQDSHFDDESVRVGSFELGMNNWLLATKSRLEPPESSNPRLGLSPQP